MTEQEFNDRQALIRTLRHYSSRLIAMTTDPEGVRLSDAIGAVADFVETSRVLPSPKRTEALLQVLSDAAERLKVDTNN
ncbi:hypothetical protein HNO88_004342 [Novosphingobium chloroacetimidivorans]|uniref:Uncharacterized protein n=1 Tax=Novosphingobium chloroacetimidivorans TaxID=1428314 RepID=A0A7W7KDT3_9SPHN|nr:hypothetical protein [Novosphingobium chloroacetimidivorans]MBB4860996.1 hypothetical protein [Novosphingobium chloroacetimidivorans]